MMTTVCFNGQVLTPLFIWRGKTIQLESNHDLPPDVLISATPKGFMTRNIFTQWLDKIIKEAKVSTTNPAIMILDAHESRSNISAIEIARTHGLHLLILPGGLTHLLQPLDKSLFRPFKGHFGRNFMLYL